jgi:trans-aconitate 2-methyltransferase
MKWDPTQYLAFADLRLRPALDLLARMPVETPRLVVDLGCGPGNLTPYLKARWPGARVLGVDGSAEMLAKARAAVEGAEFVQADIGAWTPDAAPDAIYSNAALHWLDAHDGLFPRLLGLLAPGGVLAVQMPRNHGAPSHAEIVATVLDGSWRPRLEPLLRPAPTHAPAFYYDLLAARAARLDIWETEYLQVLDGRDPVKEFTKGSALKPFLDALEGAERAAFEEAYAARLRRAYPPQADGRTLFPFRRLFLVAARA